MVLDLRDLIAVQLDLRNLAHTAGAFLGLLRVIVSVCGHHGLIPAARETTRYAHMRRGGEKKEGEKSENFRDGSVRNGRSKEAGPTGAGMCRSWSLSPSVTVTPHHTHS